jgi:hypothetical protein
MSIIPAILEVEIEDQSSSWPGQKKKKKRLARPYLSVVGHAYNPSHSGGRNRKIVVKTQAQS